jgi:dTDP-4-amino-4,6-dideoxygalactose transaminase
LIFTKKTRSIIGDHMAVPFLDLRTQYESIKPDIQKALENVFDRSNFVLGDNVKHFEAEFASYVGAKHCVGVGSGTDALVLGLMTCGVGTGDEVITVANSALATVLPISIVNATPVFAEVDETYCMAPSDIEKKITPKTKAILPVHLYGNSADIKPIAELAEKHNIKLIEDCAQAHGTEYHGRKAGTFGDVACFSFYPTKNLGAYGDGGAVITNNPEMAEKARLLRNYGQKSRYEHAIKGFNTRLDEVQAAILRVKLKKLDEWNNTRREHAKVYTQELNGVIETPLEREYAKHIYHLYVVRSQQRDALMQHLDAGGIKTLIHYPIPAYMQEAYAELGLRDGGHLSRTEAYCKEVLSLPIFPELTEQQRNEVIDTIRKWKK